MEILVVLFSFLSSQLSGGFTFLFLFMSMLVVRYVRCQCIYVYAMLDFVMYATSCSPCLLFRQLLDFGI